MNGGVIAGGIGCGGGNGYTHTGVSTVTIQNATIAAFYGTLSNGRADENYGYGHRLYVPDFD